MRRITLPDPEQQGRDADEQDAGQVDVLTQRQHDTADERDRRHHEQGARHQHEHLHLLDIVRDPGDQRRRAERADLAGRECGDAVEQLRAHVAPDPIAARDPK